MSGAIGYVSNGRSARSLALSWLAGLIICTAWLCIFVAAAGAHDDGRFANSQLKPWFDKLASGKGLCCSFADGVKVDDPDWDTQGGKDSSGYRVRLNGVWIDVPKAALVTEPNKYGPAVVWPYQDATGATQIRCFIPGSGA